MLRNIILWIICAAGGAMTGFHANKLDTTQNTVLFIVGLMMVSLTIQQMGKQTMMEKRKRNRIRNKWIKLSPAWNTAQAYQAINLLKDNRINARTLPDEFNGTVGNERMMNMNSDAMCPIFVKARNVERAIKVLSEEGLY